MEKLSSKMIIKKRTFDDIKEITQNLYNIIGIKRVQNIAPEILDEVGRLSTIIYDEKKNEDETIICELPYEIGTYLKRKDGLIDHIDLLKEYIVKQDGIYAVLVLDALRDYAKESSPIPLNEFDGLWVLANENELSHERGIQRILKR